MGPPARAHRTAVVAAAGMPAEPVVSEPVPVSRVVDRTYADPLDVIWLHAVARLGWRVVRSSEVFAAWDGRSTLTLSTPEHFDADDSLAQLIFHELCHALVEGSEAHRRPDWGLCNRDLRHLDHEHACHRLQAALACGSCWRPPPSTGLTTTRCPPIRWPATVPTGPWPWPGRERGARPASPGPRRWARPWRPAPPWRAPWRRSRRPARCGAMRATRRPLRTDSRVEPGRLGRLARTPQRSRTEEPMTPADLVARLSTQAEVWRALLTPVDEAAARRRPPRGGWSLLELTAHLADEERDDFRRRLDLTLHEADAAWPPIDPEGWVQSRDYASKPWPGVLHDFLEERARSLAWLAGLVEPRWTASHAHPAFGAMAAGDLLASWVAHDLRHLGQAARLLHGALADGVAPFSVEYAG